MIIAQTLKSISHTYKTAKYNRYLPTRQPKTTATYEKAKYLNTLLTPLTKSQYNILSIGDFIQEIKSEKIPKRFEMISFDVKNLFSNVSLHQTIKIILSKV